MNKNFAHLHLHTQYSVLDGAIKIPKLINRLEELKQPAVAITDHGVMHGAIDFYYAAKNSKIKPILGCEIYLSSDSRFNKTPKTQGGPETFHMTLLAKNNVGYKNLCRVVSRAYLEGFYFKPRADYELLKEYSEGIVCLSGCCSSHLSYLATRENIEEARDVVEKCVDIYDDDFYIEIQPHELEKQKKLNALSYELASEYKVPLVATNDCHYLNKEDKRAQEVLMCVSMGKLITDPDRMRHDDAELYLKSTEEMYQSFKDVPEALENTIKIADKCNVDFDFSNYRMPKFNTPKGVNIDDYFTTQVENGLSERFLSFKERGINLDLETKEKYKNRLKEEISLIKKMGFSGYFLVVSDFIRWSKKNSVPVGPGRGSAAGSLVAYALFITEIDPIEHNLLFERFLNPERVSMPDIDVDFCINGRDKVIQYVSNKYGKDRVSQICTFGTLKAKAVIKDVGRVLGLSYAETDKIAKLIPQPRQGFDYPIAESLKMEKKLRDYAEGEGKELIDLALKLEGLSRHTSTHAAGVVISDEPVMDVLPLLVDKDGQVVTQFSMNWVEKVGLVKFDFLGLKTLTVIQTAVNMIKEGTGREIDINSLRTDDTKTFRLISSGNTIGVFQLESTGITDMVTRLKPNCFEDIVAILALYRPGPLDAGMVDHYINRKHGREKLKYLHPILEPILKDSYGIILYQEQIMRIARDMGGYSLGQADMLRRAMGKKKPKEMAKHRALFIDGALERGVKKEIASEVFNQMETFARYGFNRSHSVAYALISYQTAYLKAHYPAYLMTSLMTHEMHDTDKTLKNINECRNMNIEVSPPNLNEEGVGFYVSKNKILFGLGGIKGVGSKAVESLVEERKKNGKFKSFLDYCKRVDSSLLNRRLVEHFIKSGAFDWTSLARAELVERMDEVIKYATKIKEENNSPQLDLFSVLENKKEEIEYTPRRELKPEWASNVKLAYEKEALGFYLSGHPLEKFSSELKRFGATTIDSLANFVDGSMVSVAGVVSLLKLKNTKKGDRYATFLLEDLLGVIDVLVWPDVYKDVYEILSSEEPVVVKAKLEVSDERRQLIAKEITSAISLRDKTAREVILKLNSKDCSKKKFNNLKKVFKNYPGTCNVKMIIKENNTETIISLPDEIKIGVNEKMCNKIEEITGFVVRTVGE